MIVLLLQKDEQNNELLTPEDIYPIGILSRITQVIKLPDDTHKVLFQGQERINISSLQMDSYVVNDYQILTDTDQENCQDIMQKVAPVFEEFNSANLSISPQVVANILGNQNSGQVADTIASYLTLNTTEKQQFIELTSIKTRLELLFSWLNREKGRFELEKHLNKNVQNQIEKIQKESFLREKMRTIQKELGEENIDVQEYREKFSELPDEIIDKAERELTRLSYFSYTSAEYGVIRDYLNWLLNVPWQTGTQDLIDLQEISRFLDEKHYGLKEVKNRVIEFLARYKRTGKVGGSILLLYGPPGVGKTSVAHAIASAMGREFSSISLGGVSDESELRGHRRTYVGSVPGRLVQAIVKTGSNNPLILLDEVDKIGSGGNVTSALLEVLDPEQNSKFFDRYLEIPVDLSKVIFILTANDVNNIPNVLKNRVEVLSLPGYTEDEKLGIAIKYLIPQVLKDNGFNEKELSFTDEVVRRIIRENTRETGVRELKRVIDRICRKHARMLLENQKDFRKVSNHNLHHFLETKKSTDRQSELLGKIGYAYANRWSVEGNTLLKIESSLLSGKGELVISSNFSDDLLKTAKTIIGFIRRNYDYFGIEQTLFQQSDLFINLSSYLRERDLDSLGLPLAVSIISAITNKKAKDGYIFIGDVSLNGELEEVNNIEERILSAAFNNPENIIVSVKNKHDTLSIAEKLKKNTKISYCSDLQQVIESSLG